MKDNIPWGRILELQLEIYRLECLLCRLTKVMGLLAIAALVLCIIDYYI